MNETRILVKQDAAAVKLCSKGSIEIAGQTLVADQTKAYVEFSLSHSFPIRTCDGTTIHPATVAASYRSMLHQVFNVGHIMRAYNPEEHHRDRIIGSIVAVEYPKEPMGGWKVQGEPGNAPGIRAAAVVHKSAEWADKILGEHLGGRREWTVSMESLFRLTDSGFLVKDEDLLGEFSTPEDLAELGWAYLPWEAAPDKLMECFDAKKVCMGSWGKREALLLMGGLSGKVHYHGVGIVHYGKEPTAKIATMLASRDAMAGPDVDAVEAARLVPAVE